MKPEELHYYTCSRTNDDNTNDFDTMLAMMRKLVVPIVTIHQNSTKLIIYFGTDNAIKYHFYRDKLMDIRADKISFSEWIDQTPLLLQGNDIIITIYNR